MKDTEVRYHIFCNEASGSGKQRIFEGMKAIFEARQIPYRFYQTKSKEETIEIVQRLSKKQEESNPMEQKGKVEQINSSDGGESDLSPIEQKDKMEQTSSSDAKKSRNHLIVAGGDGSLNSLMQGIEDFDAVTVSCVPVGSGNDFAKGLGIPKEPLEVLEKILDAPTERVIDYGEARTYDGEELLHLHRFLISAGIGYDAETCQQANESRLKKLLNLLHLGKLIYLVTGVRNMIFRDPCRAKITLDDERCVRLSEMFLSVGMVQPYEGGGIPFCYMADCEDGKLDVCLVKNMSLGTIAIALVSVYLKQHYRFKAIKHYTCQKLEINLSKEKWYHVDGETPFQAKKIVMECKQGLHLLQ